MDIFLNWRKKNLITIIEFFESNLLIPDRYQLTLIKKLDVLKINREQQYLCKIDELTNNCSELDNNIDERSIPLETRNFYFISTFGIDDWIK